MKRNERFKVLTGAFIVIAFLSECKKEDSKPSTTPFLTTRNVSAIKIISATCGGNISNDGGKPIIARGICWSKQFQPTIADSITNDGVGIGSFTSELTKLTPFTTYYVRAYASNTLGTSYGITVKFSTFDFPKANVCDIRVVSNSSIICRLTDLNSGGGTNSEYGICWNTNANPTIESNHIVVPKHFSNQDYFTLDNLANNTTYHIRGYAINEGGVGYGDELTFTTYNWEVGSITDIDNNSYKTIKIGTQVWMQENLKVTHYSNGNEIANVTDNSQWANLSTGAYCWFQNDENSNKNKYGALYNWYTVVDSRNLCPTGWHVPSADEWVILTTYLGGSEIAGSKMKAYSWTNYNTNESGFSGIPCGFRGYEFSEVDKMVYLWSSTEHTSYASEEIGALGPYIMKLYDFFRFESTGKKQGRNVRCVKD